jgi:hypothetical protein
MPAFQEMLLTLQEIRAKFELCMNEEKIMKMTVTFSDKLPKVTVRQHTFENVRE